MNTGFTDGHGSEPVKTRTIRVHPCPVQTDTDEHRFYGLTRIYKSVKTRTIRVHPCPIQLHTDEHGLDRLAQI